jgi:leucyl aminopeptidase
MDIIAKTGKIQEESIEVLVLQLFEKSVEMTQEWPLPESIRSLEEPIQEIIRQILQENTFKGKTLETHLVHLGRRSSPFPKAILVMGLGKKEECTLETIRRVAGKAVKEISKKGFATYGVELGTWVEAVKVGADLKSAPVSSLERVVQAFVEGALLGLYKFDPYKSQKEEGPLKEVTQLVLIHPGVQKLSEIKKGIQVAQVISEAVNFTRDLINTPANDMTPSELANQAKQMAKWHHLKCQIFTERKLSDLKMGALLAVAKGSDEPPRFIILEHHPKQGAGSKEQGADSEPQASDTVVLVGKGVTFDSGGISLKPSKGMYQMKTDMSGAAAVIGTLQAIASLDLPLHVVGLVGATENLPSGKAIKPGDIITSLSGTTIEILDTDAEGRLVLADALAYARRYNPKAVIDLATLTGACVVTLARIAAGMMGNNRALLDQVRQAGEISGERVWELPLWDEYKELVKSKIADLKNITEDVGAGTIMGGAFLSYFTKDYPWVHLDIANVARNFEEKPYTPEGGTGFGVRLLIEFLRSWMQVL